MRLLHTTLLTFAEWDGIAPKPYAILSHCWNHDPGYQEVTYQQVLSGASLSDLPGWQKVRRCCRIAKSRGFDWVWIDTACLDKTNSTELSETVNSMLSYYKGSAECYVFLDDVLIDFTSHIDAPNGLNNKKVHLVSDIGCSRWFTRGWTLQELLAPSTVLFFDKVGEYIGTRSDLAATISATTGIHPRYLIQEADIREASVAQRMSWASRRRTTRPEDIAYSLLGIFNVNMALLYGEGAKAFERLQLAIIAQSDDESIFAWGLQETLPAPTGMLASHPEDFSGSENVESFRNPRAKTGSAFEGTPRGIWFRYTPRLTETLMAPPYQHMNMLKRIRLACRIVEKQGRVRTIDVKIKFHRGRFCRIGLEVNKPARIVDIIRDVVGGERRIYVASSLDNIDNGEANLVEQNMWSKSGDLPPHELLQWPARWILSNVILLYWFFFRFDSKEMNVIALFLVLMLVNDIRLSGLSAALLILVVVPAGGTRWAQSLRLES